MLFIGIYLLGMIGGFIYSAYSNSKTKQDDFVFVVLISLFWWVGLGKLIIDHIAIAFQSVFYTMTSFFEKKEKKFSTVEFLVCPKHEYNILCYVYPGEKSPVISNSHYCRECHESYSILSLKRK